MLWFALALQLAHSSPIIDIPQVGKHYRVLTLDKNENPQNLLAIYTKLNADCTFAPADHSRLLGYYWLMNGERYKRVNPLILQGIRSRIEEEPNGSKSAFVINFGDLKELDNDLGEEPITVQASRNAEGKCHVEADLKLGPSNGGERIRLTNIHSESKKTFWPPFRKVMAVTLSGTDVKDGHFVRRTYSAKKGR